MVGHLIHEPKVAISQTRVTPREIYTEMEKINKNELFDKRQLRSCSKSGARREGQAAHFERSVQAKLRNTTSVMITNGSEGGTDTAALRRK